MTSPEGPDTANTAGADDAVRTNQAPPSAEPPPRKGLKRKRKKGIHEVVFITYPKLLFIWPLILAGLVFYYPLGKPHEPISAVVSDYEAAQAKQADEAAPADTQPAEGASTKLANPFVSRRLEVLGWIYIWIAVLVLLTLGVDVGRNQAVFWVVCVVAVWALGLWLHDAKGFTVFGDIHRWFANRDVQYNRSFALALSIIMLVPYVIMLIYARLNDRWRITHNEFEHYSLGKMDDSLGRGAKTIRTSFPDVFELLLGLAGTLVVYNATGTRELRCIPHVMFLPFVRKRLNRILERTAITAAAMEDDDEDDDDA
ncbi:MAG: hypothetical protein ACE5I3_04185 [Phycisphaerae bacterium]